MSPAERPGTRGQLARSLRRGVAAAFIVVSVALLVILFAKGKKPVPQPVEPERAVNVPKVDEREGVRYVEYRGGKEKILFQADRSYSAPDGQYHMAGHVEIHDFGREGGRQILASCDEIIHDPDRTKFKLKGHAVVHMEKATFATDTLDYDREKDAFSTAGDIVITSPKFTGSAKGLLYSLKTQEVWLQAEVRLETKVSNTSPVPLVMTSPTLYYSKPIRRGRFEGGVTLVHGKSSGTCDTVEFQAFTDTDKLDQVFFRGKVRFHLEKEIKDPADKQKATPSASAAPGASAPPGKPAPAPPAKPASGSPVKPVPAASGKTAPVTPPPAKAVASQAQPVPTTAAKPSPGPAAKPAAPAPAEKSGKSATSTPPPAGPSGAAKPPAATPTVKPSPSAAQAAPAAPPATSGTNQMLSLGENQDVRADEVKLRAFLNTSVIHSYESKGNAAITFRSSTKGDTHFEADSIDFIFEEDGSLREFRAKTRVKMKKVEADGETQTAEGDSLLLPWKQDVLQIKPKEGGKVTSTFRGNSLETDVLGLNVKNNDFQTAAAKARFEPSADKKPVGLFAGDKPVFITAHWMKYATDTKSYRFFGGVKMWQERNELYGDDVELDETTGETRCAGAVRSIFPHKPKDQPKEEIVEITGQKMHYDADKGTAFYEGTDTAPTGLKTSSFSLTSQNIRVLLAKDNKDPKEITALSKVVIIQPNREGHGEEAHYLVDDRLLVLTGNPVVTEKNKGESRGDKLTFHLADDTITVENSERTRSVTKIKSPEP